MIKETSNNIFETLFSLKDKVAIVTGAAGQLGGEYVQTLLASGALVAAFDIKPNSPKSQIKNIKSKNLILIQVDITDKISIKKGLDGVVSSFGDPDILINNAAIDAPPNASEQDTGPFEDYPESSWNAMMEVNLKGAFLCCQVIGKHMAEKGVGSIINVSSIYGTLSPDQRIYEYKETSFFKPITYCVTKGALLNFSRYLATYWSKKGVRVNTIVLGGVYNGQDETFVKNYTSKVPLGRMASQKDYNGAILFLASDASSYMTGSTLTVDGGYSCW